MPTLNISKIDTPLAPRAIGPYSQAVSSNGFIFLSGQIPIDPKTGELVESSIVPMTHQVISNIKAILESEGSSLNHVVSCQVYLKNLKRDFMPMNEVYLKHFTSQTPPARATVEVSDLPLGSLIEISCIALATQTS